jgi:hypothetical protein
MFKNLLNLKGVSLLSKEHQVTVYGGSNPSREGIVSFSDSASIEEEKE